MSKTHIINGIQNIAKNQMNKYIKNKKQKRN